MILRARDLSESQKTIIEALLGRRLSADESVSVRAFEASSCSDPQIQRGTEELRSFFLKSDARRTNVPDAKGDEVIDDAIRSVRAGYRSPQ